MQTVLSASKKLVMFLALFATVAAVEAILPWSGAAAQMSREPFRFRVHGNPTAANMAVIMRQVESGALNGNSSASAPVVAGSSNPMGAITQYNSTTIGNMNEINTILESGAQGYVSLDTSQDGSQSSQSATSEGTQVYGGNTAIGSGDPTANAGTVTTNTAESTNDDQQGQQ